MVGGHTHRGRFTRGDGKAHGENVEPGGGRVKQEAEEVDEVKDVEDNSFARSRTKREWCAEDAEARSNRIREIAETTCLVLAFMADRL